MPAKRKKSVSKSLSNDAISRAVLGKELQRQIDRLGLSRNDAARIVRDAASQMSRLMTGHFNEFSADRMVAEYLELFAQLVFEPLEERPLREFGKGGSSTDVWSPTPSPKRR